MPTEFAVEAYHRPVTRSYALAGIVAIEETEISCCGLDADLGSLGRHFKWTLRQPYLPMRRSPFISIIHHREGEMDKTAYAPKNWEIAR